MNAGKTMPKKRQGGFTRILKKGVAHRRKKEKPRREGREKSFPAIRPATKGVAGGYI